MAIFTFLEWGAIKLGMYLLNLGADLSTLDILSIVGYNYVGMISAIFIGLILGSYGKWIAFAYSSVCMFFFIVSFYVV